MDALLAAIQAKLAGSALSTALGGKLYADEAPQGTALPYATHSIADGVPLYTFTDREEHVRVQFDLYHATQAGVLGLYNNLKSLYDDCQLSVSGYTFQKMERDFYQKLKEEFYWKVIVQYKVWLEEV